VISADCGPGWSAENIFARIFFLLELRLARAARSLARNKESKHAGAAHRVCCNVKR